jgi:3-hydroxybutyryl-CoA dehydratase
VIDRTLSSDFDALREGDRFATAARTISEADVALFAELTGDRHPQHTDAAWAASSVFGERVAHGLLVLACAAGLVSFDPERVVALRRVRELVFKRPVRLGEAVRVEGRVRAVKPLEADLGLVGVELRVLRGDDLLALRAVLEVLWKREHGATGEPQAAEASGA